MFQQGTTLATLCCTLPLTSESCYEMKGFLRTACTSFKLHVIEHSGTHTINLRPFKTTPKTKDAWSSRKLIASPLCCSLETLAEIRSETVCFAGVENNIFCFKRRWKTLLSFWTREKYGKNGSKLQTHKSNGELGPALRKCCHQISTLLSNHWDKFGANFRTGPGEFSKYAY